MRLLKFFTFFAFFASFAAFAASGAAQEISGRYEGTAEVAPFGKLPIKAEIRQKDNKFSGSFETPVGNSGIIEGALTGENLKLIVDADGNDVVLDGKISNGRFSGKVSSDAINGNFELTRAGDAPDLAYVLTQSREKWREDLRFVAQELPKKHKNAFHTASREQFENAVAELDKKIPTLNDSQIIMEMSKLFTMIGDGHTALQWNWAFDAVPARFFWFGKELRVFRSGKEFPRLVGAKLEKIGGVSVEELFRRSQPLIAQKESPHYVLAANAYRLSFPIFLQSLGAAKTNDSAVYEFVDAKGKRFSQELKTVSADAPTDWVYAFRENKPLWLQNRDKQLFYKYLPESKTVYVQFASYPRRREFKKFSDELFAFIDSSDVRKIVFDLRLNEGGDFTRGQEYFIKPLKERPKLTAKGRLFVLAGRWTYSAGMSNTAHFRNDLGAFIVGEPTGARPNGYQEVRSFRLPNSKLEGWYSVELYKFADKDTDGLLPDKLIEPDWKSFQAGRDSALEWILAYSDVK